MREPKGVPVIRWRCVSWGCRKSYADRSKARKHAAICLKDPDNRGCLTCEHFDDAEAGGWEDPGCDASCAAGVELPKGDPLPRGCPSWELSDSQRRRNPHAPALPPIHPQEPQEPSR